MHALASSTLETNWRDGYTIPSARLYPFQWNWDSGFIALGLAWSHPPRALEEVRSMFRGQWSNGLLPHINFHKPNPDYFPGPDVWQTAAVPAAPRDLATSGITQPPVFAFVLERLLTTPAAQLPGWPEFLAELYPKILAFHRYLYTRRDPHGEGLVYIQHNWESGTDNSPAWDAVLDAIDVTHAREVAHLRRDIKSVDAAHRPTNENYRRYIALVDLFARHGYDDAAIARESPFLVQDVLFNSLLARSNQSLITLGRRLGHDTAEIEAWQEKTVAAINNKLWDGEAGHYFSYDLRAGRPLRVRTSSGFAPLFAGVCPPAQADRLLRGLATHFMRNDAWSLCASTAATETAFDPVKYWRGPVWINMNWLLHHGLARYGRTELAARIKADSLRFMAEHGCFEYFDPRPVAGGGSAHGLGADAFSWSAALYLDFTLNPAPL